MTEHDIERVRKGSRLLYTEGRDGHNGVMATVRNVSYRYMIVKFEDRTDKTAIKFDDKEWMKHLSLHEA